MQLRGRRAEEQMDEMDVIEQEGCSSSLGSVATAPWPKFVCVELRADDSDRGTMSCSPSGFADGRGDFPLLDESGLHDSWADAHGGAGRGGQLGDKPASVGHHPFPMQQAQRTSCELKGEPATAIRGQRPWRGMASKCGESRSFLPKSSLKPNICLKSGRAQLTVELILVPVSSSARRKEAAG